MRASSPVDGVRSLAESAAARAGLVLESITVSPAGRRRVLRVVVDLPDDRLGGVPMDAVTLASQELSAALDASAVMGTAPYVLEVSSPGADRALTEPRHWRRSRGRLVQARLADGTSLTGRLIAVSEAGVLIDQAEVGWDRVVRGRVEIEFSRPGEPDNPDPDEDDPAPAVSDEVPHDEFDEEGEV